MSDDDKQGSPFRRYDGGWVTLPNEAVNDASLSFRARGLLAWLLGRPPGWTFSAIRIAKGSPKEGREAVLTALQELEGAGYIRRLRLRASDGTIRTITEAAALPSLLPALEPPESAQPAPVQPGPAQPAPKSVPDAVKTDVVKPQETRAARAVPVTSWSGPDDNLYQWAKEQGWTGSAVDFQTAAMRDWALSKGEKKVDWNAALRNWLRRQTPPPRPTSSGGAPIPSGWR